MMDDKQFCNLPVSTGPLLPPGIGEMRERALVLTQNKWVNGTRLTYFFKNVGPFIWPNSQKQVVRDAFGAWKSLGIGLDFSETSSEAEAILIIGLVQGDGSWSWIGTDVLHNRRNDCNMNFGWDLRTAWGKSTALHEIGHAIGMPHEHQNPKSGIVWNEAEVIAYFSGPPNNWDEPTIRWNILRHLSASEVEGSEWDPASIMHYAFQANMIDAPSPYSNEGVPASYDFSAKDRAWASRFYPPVALSDIAELSLGETVPLAEMVGEQADFLFRPTDTREYSLQTFGEADRKIAIAHILDDGSSEMLKVRDDSATDSNAQIVRELVAGQIYRISARTHFAPSPGANTIMMQ